MASVREDINTLEDSLRYFDLNCLLEQLDVSLELVRRNKATEKEHLDVLKSVDKNLLKQSLIYHPDKATDENGAEVKKRRQHNLQVALNATRTVLQALTKAFLKDIDVFYRYEFFAKMNVTSLINEKEMDRQITHVLSKIGLLSEVKRVSIVGEIRKFLKESRESLRSYLEVGEDEFERHRDFALRHLHKCIEGYEVFDTECDLIVKECRGEQDGSAMTAILKMAVQSQIEMEILRDLKKVAEKSLDGKFQFFSIFKLANSYDRYLISPFVLYINVMSMCTTVMNSKSRLRNLFKSNTYNSIHFNTRPDLFIKAYNLASYFNNKNQYEKAVENILQKKGLVATYDNIIKEFKDVVTEIAIFLTEEFDINTYKEGKSDRLRFAEKLSKLNESMTGHKEIEKLRKTFDLCEKQAGEIRKEFFEHTQKFEDTEDQCRKNILKCKDTEEKISKLISGCYQQEEKLSRIYCGNVVNGSVNCNEIDEDSTEKKLYEKLAEYENFAGDLLKFLTDCRQNISGSAGSFGSQNECTEQVEKKIKASYELNKEIGEQLYYLMMHADPKSANQGSGSEGNLEDSPVEKSNVTPITADEMEVNSEF